MRKLEFCSLAVALLLPVSLSGQTTRSAKKPAGYLTANPYLGTPVGPYDPLVSEYSPYGARNQYTMSGADIVARDGQYLGHLNSNPYDPYSVANPYGIYGSQYSPTSINNPYGVYGSQYSPYSATNPYASTPPLLYLPERP